MDHIKDGRRLLTLTRKNYARWIIEVEDVLRSKSLWSHVTGRVTVVAEPKEDEDSKPFDAWDSKDSKARSIIRGSLDEATFNHVRDCKTSKQIIDRIRELREPKTTDALMTSLTEFFATGWKDEDDVSSFMASLAVIASRINTVKPKMVTDEFIIAKTLTSLPSEFDTFVQSWYLVAKEESTLSEFREKLLTAERGMSRDEWTEYRGDALKAGRKSKDRRMVKKSGKPIVCFHCGKPGHIIKDCPEQSSETDENSAASDESDQESVGRSDRIAVSARLFSSC